MICCPCSHVSFSEFAAFYSQDIVDRSYPRSRDGEHRILDIHGKYQSLNFDLYQLIATFGLESAMNIHAEFLVDPFLC